MIPFLSKERKIMKILVEHDFDSLKNQNKNLGQYSGMSIRNIAKEAKFGVDETYVLVQKLVAYHYLGWTDRKKCLSYTYGNDNL